MYLITLDKSRIFPRKLDAGRDRGAKFGPL